MKPVGITLFQELKATPGFENCIIAGGFVRDSIFKKEYSDIDVFVPYDDVIKKEKEGPIKLPKTLIQKNNTFDFKYSYLKIEEKWDYTYHDVVDVDIILVKSANDKNFAETVVDNFDFGINKVWYDGEIHKTKDFVYDENGGYITLQKLNTISELPYLMKRFFNLQSKFPGFEFGSKVEFVNPNEKLTYNKK